MPTITTKDGSSIFYKDWGSGQPLVFSHGWPLNADAWDEQLNFFASRGFRTIAHDRRGHGRSTQTWAGNEMDTYADDLHALVDKLDLKDAIFIGHSTGGGEVTRYLGRHGTKRAKKAVLMSAVPPGMIKSATNAAGIPREVFDDIRKNIATNRSQFYKDFSAPFFGANRSGSTVAQGVRDQFWLQCMTVGTRNSYECIKAFSETDFTEDLKKIDIPVLVLHGDDDQIVPLPISGALSSKLLKKATLNVYQGAPHGLMATHRDRMHEDLAGFFKG